jgi:Exopolysaccharide biosynthesis protein related to N-acetylglucosamine-1-phosphodiester alpha-N-acetylglucosaminidase
MFNRFLLKKLGMISLIFIFVLLLIGVGKYFYNKSIILPSSTGQAVIKTSEANGYNPGTTASSSKAMNSSTSKSDSEAEISVKNTGEAGWVKIKSQGALDKFTDLSTGSFKIYKAHKPQILKTATSDDSPVMSMSEVVSKYPNSLIMNASGFNMSTGKVTGFQINNGKLFKGWNSDKRAKSAFVINKDGSAKVYDSSTPASDILQNGANMSFSFGSILIRDGKSLPSDGSVNWEIHSILGNDKNNNIYLIISDTSTGYQSIMAQLQSLNLENAIVMDGGGSSQMSLNGQTIYPSQDNRSVNDYIVLK